MAVPALPLALGGASLLSGMMGNKGAQRSANRAQNMQDQLAQRVMALFDTMMGKAQSLDSELAPDRQIRNLASDTAHYSGLDQANTAGALRVAGYQPGDSEIGTRLDAVALKHRRAFGEMANDIRTRSPLQRMSLLSMVNGGQLNGLMDMYGNREQMYRSQMRSPGGLFGSLASLSGGRGFNLQ